MTRSSTQLKVLFLTNIPSPYRVDFFNELGKSCDLTVLYELHRSSNRDRSWQANGTRTFREVYLRGIRVRADAALCPDVVRYLVDPSFDIIVVGGYSTPTGMLALTILKSMRKHYILNIDGGQIRDDGRVARCVKRFFLGGAPAYLSPSRRASQYLVHYGGEEGSIFLYPFGSVSVANVLEAPLPKEERELLRKQLGIGEELVVLGVGRFIHGKGFDLLINSAAYLGPRVGVYIIGGEPPTEYIKLRDSLGITNVHFGGFRDADSLRQYYRAADVFALPTRGDVWGLVVNEALAQALPVVTTEACGAGHELIRPGENGYLVETNNALDLATAIRSVLDQDEDEARRMRVAALETGERYTLEAMALRHVEIFHQTTG